MGDVEKNENENEKIQTIKEIKNEKKKRKKYDLTEQERKRRSDNFKNNALQAKKKIYNDEQALKTYQQNIQALLNSGEDEENNVEEIQEEIKQIGKNKKNNKINENKNFEIEGLKQMLNDNNGMFEKHLKTLYESQEKINNRVEKLYQLKKLKNNVRKEPIIINNESKKDNKNFDLQSAIMNKILNQ